MKFFIYMKEKVAGPYEPDDIVKHYGGVSPDMLVCFEQNESGSAKWRKISLVPELARCIKNEIAEPVAEVRSVPGHRHSLQILSTDDDSNIRELLWNMLADAGHAVEFARDGEEVFKRLGEKQYDLVILDVNMPKMNGYKVSELIHKKISQPPKVIIFTGRDLQKERLQFVCSGADAILSKGIDNDKLIRTIDGLFSRKPARAEKPRETAFTPEPAPPALSELPAAVPEAPGKEPEAIQAVEKPPVSKLPPPVLAEPPVQRPPLPVPAGLPDHNKGTPLREEGFFEDPGQGKSGAPAVPEPRPVAEAITMAAPAAALQPACKTAEAPPAASDPLTIKVTAPWAAPEDMHRLLGHLDLECARLETQFEKQALKILETHQAAAQKLQAEWLSLRRFVTLTALLLAAVSVAALLFVTLR